MDHNPDADATHGMLYDASEQQFSIHWNSDFRSAIARHHVTAETSFLSDKEVRSKMTDSAKRFVLNRMPPVPSPSKWTKGGPCIDFLIASWIPRGLLPACHQLAFGKLAFETKERQETDHNLFGELFFSEVTGSRCRTNTEFLNCSESKFRIVLLGIAIEPIRFITGALLACCKTVQDHSKHPLLLDMMNPKLSKFTAVQQYIASVLMHTREPSRLTLLAGAVGLHTKIVVTDRFSKLSDYGSYVT
ncbi:unnamed protein product [Polarella glacialis]|uniref:Uncharacterized protein n=1 Tax=Polarella glacialis TaxID=89957 RepID=A0A813L4B3_POLGL|nr:unnamed protein product [Polarella glacialis]